MSRIAVDLSGADKYKFFRMLDYIEDPLNDGREFCPYDPLGQITPSDGNLGQADFHRAADEGKRFIALFGGSGLGKSMSAAREGSWMAMHPKKNIWLVGSEYDLVGKEFEYMWQDLIVTLKLPVVRKARDPRNGNFLMEFPWGTKVEGKSEKVINTLLGQGLDLLILCEGAKLKKLTYTRFLRRAIARREGTVICNTTPSGYNWVYDNFMIPAQNGHELYWAGVYDVLSNPFYSRKEYGLAREELSTEIFQEQFQGKFVRFSGLVFNNFDRRIHCVNHIRLDDEWPLWMFIDLNHSKGHQVLFMGISPWEQRLFVDEIFHKCDLKELAAMIRQKVRMMGRHPNFCVFDGPEIDNSEDGVHIRRIMSEAGISGKKARKMPKGAQFLDMNQLLKQSVTTNAGEEPLIVINEEKVKNFPWELEHLEWHESESTRSERVVPQDKNDHAIDCWRYGEAEGVKFDFVNVEQDTGFVDFGRPLKGQVVGV